MEKGSCVILGLRASHSPLREIQIIRTGLREEQRLIMEKIKRSADRGSR